MIPPGDIPIIMISMSQWDGDNSSASISLSKELAKTNKVFYVEHPVTYKSIITDWSKKSIQIRIKSLLQGRDIYRNSEGFPDKFKAVTPKAVLPINWMPRGKLYNWLAHFNDRLIYHCIKRILDDNHIDRYILFNSFNPFYGHDLPYKDKLLLYIYQTRDNVSAAPYVNRHGPEGEKRLVKMADIVFATSSMLKKKLMKIRKDVHLLANACDDSVFFKEREYEIPQEYKSTPDKTRVLFIGSIDQRVDYELLMEVARLNPQLDFIMVGPLKEKKYPESFFEINNLLFLGSKPLKDLPAYLEFASCAIIPFRSNKLTESIYPLKLNEYFAMGKPVVSTTFSEDIKSFADNLYLGDTVSDFNFALKEALKEDQNQKEFARKEIAMQNTWEKRVNQFWNHVNEKLEDVYSYG